jgi:hypothetical protein
MAREDNEKGFITANCKTIRARAPDMPHLPVAVLLISSPSVIPSTRHFACRLTVMSLHPTMSLGIIRVDCDIVTISSFCVGWIQCRLEGIMLVVVGTVEYEILSPDIIVELRDA